MQTEFTTVNTCILAQGKAPTMLSAQDVRIRKTQSFEEATEERLYEIKAVANEAVTNRRITDLFGPIRIPQSNRALQASGTAKQGRGP